MKKVRFKDLSNNNEVLKANELIVLQGGATLSHGCQHNIGGLPTIVMLREQPVWQEFIVRHFRFQIV
jgi:hypothetical protein